MNRKELSECIKIYLDGRPWDRNSSAIFKRRFKKEYEDLNIITFYLDRKHTIAERIYHIVHNLNSIQLCKYCDSLVNFYGFKTGYSTVCGNAECITKYKRDDVDEMG